MSSEAYHPKNFFNKNESMIIIKTRKLSPSLRLGVAIVRAWSGDDRLISRVFLGAIYKRPITANVDSYDCGNYYT